MLFAHILGAAAILSCLVLLIAAGESDDERRERVWQHRLRKPALTAMVVLLLSGGHLSFATGLLQSTSVPLLLIKIALGLLALGIALLLLREPTPVAVEPASGPQARLALLLALGSAFLGAWIGAGHLPAKTG